MAEPNFLQRIRFWLAVFIAGMLLSGVTAFPLRRELHGLVFLLQMSWLRPVAQSTGLLPWIERVRTGVDASYSAYPFLAYGTDWLAFAHMVIAVAFVGPWIDPVRNRWVITFGLIACAGVVPLALIAGEIRGIPILWRLIDCGFGVFGSIPLLLCRQYLLALEHKMHR
ncbi:MAG: hypothetical protein WA891_21305 [Acidobacteriaceae bacterium]